VPKPSSSNLAAMVSSTGLVAGFSSSFLQAENKVVDSKGYDCK
jgi:hypothetical protein